MKDILGSLLRDWRVRTVLPHVRGRLLDIGCGINKLVRSYEGEGVGVDVHQWGDVDVIVENSADLPFEDESFDTVAIVATLNHIPNRTEVLTAVHKLLRPGGTIIITMIPPRISRVWHFLRRPWDADQTERGMKEGEVYGFSASDVRRLLSQVGFDVARTKRFMLGVNRMTIARKPPLEEPQR